MRLIVATSFCLAALAACGPKADEAAIKVEAPMVHLPAVKGRPGSAYFTLRSNAGEAKLLGVTSPKVSRVELHDSAMEKGISRMRRVESLAFSGSAEFKPGGKHAMLFGLDPSLKPGAKVPLTFTFEAAPPLTVEATVHGPGGGGHAGH